MSELKLMEDSFKMHRKATEAFLDQNNYEEAAVSLNRAIEVLLELAERASGAEKARKTETAKELAKLLINIKLKISPAEQTAAPGPTGGRARNASAQEQAKTGGEQAQEGEGGMFRASVSQVKFKDVFGAQDIKDFVISDWIERFDPKFSKIYEGKFVSALERGILLYGLPGCGKTMVAQAIAGEVDAVFYSLNAKDFLSKYVGETEKNISEIFEQASKDHRAIIYIDEIDSVLSRSEDSKSHEVSAQNMWLQMMDGFNREEFKNICIIGATNFPNKILPSALRSGRLGRHFRVDLPDLALRTELLKKRLPLELVSQDLSVDYLARKLCCYNIADILGVCNRILASREYEAKERIRTGDFEAEVKITRALADAVLDKSHSSVSQESVREIALFEKNYNIVKEGALGAFQYLEKLKSEV